MHSSRAALAAIALVAKAAAVAGMGGAAPPALADAAAGAAKAAACIACHGAEGVSPDAQWPHLAGQHAAYTAKQLANFQSGARDNAIMAGMTAALSEEDMRDIAEHYATQQPASSVAADAEKVALGDAPSLEEFFVLETLRFLRGT